MIRMTVAALCLLVAACTADAPAPDDQATMDPDAEALSLSGTPLYRPPLSDESRATREAALVEAEAALAADSTSVDAIVWVGRRLAYLGRYRDAVDVYTRGLERFPDSPHLLRHRGHRWITLRRFGQAVADLSRAAELTLDRPDEVEPDGQPNAAGIPTSTLQTNIWYHLGLAHYLLGRFDAAETAFRRCHDLAANDDMRIAATDWIYMSARRSGRHDEAREAIAWVEPGLQLLENHAYHRRIQFYRGMLPVDSMLSVEQGEDRNLTLATQGYGVGNWYLSEGDTSRAAEIYRQVIGTGFWPAFGFVAAEADLVRIGE